MPLPSDIGIIDLMVGLPGSPADRRKWYSFLAPGLRDKESQEKFEMPAQYMFKDIPINEESDDYVEQMLRELDRWGVSQAMIGTKPGNELANEALARFPERFFGSYEVDPNRGMDGVRELEFMVREHGVKAATAFPAGYTPQVPINDKRFYPIYAKCVELDIPICVCVGIPGPRVPAAPQHMELVDEVCWFFPELKFVTRHGCEPWTELAVKLMLKWPNLYYSTSAFAPRYYPKAIIDYANTRGTDKILYAGYYPMGLSMERIMTEMADVPFRDHVWPKFLRENAQRVFKL